MVTNAHTAVLHEVMQHLPKNAIFQKDGTLVHVATGAGLVHAITPLDMTRILSDVVDFRTLRHTKQGPFVDHIQPPSWLVNEILQAKHWSAEIIPHLRFVSDGPVFLLHPSPRILSTNGYDAASKVYVTGCPPSVEPPPMTLDEARSLFDKLLGEFPFNSPEDYAAAVAMCVSSVARAAFPGPMPLVLIDGDDSGQGKSLLARLGLLFAISGDAEVTSFPKSKEELEKKLGSLLAKCKRVILFDNVVGAFGSDAIDALLTSERFEIRELGKTRIISVKNEGLIIVTGNKIYIIGDLVRRIVLIRFKPQPDGVLASERQFANPNLVQWAIQHRHRLLLAAATVLQTFHDPANGHTCPDFATSSMGSFGGWNATVRAAVAWFLNVDPLASQKEMGHSMQQMQMEQRSALFAAWFAFAGKNRKTLSEVVAGDTPAALRDALMPFGWDPKDPQAALGRLRQSFPRHFVSNGRSEVRIPGQSGTFRFERTEVHKVNYYALVRSTGKEPMAAAAREGVCLL